jgi:CRP/FNR family transcriptional regulator, cyclic AMP receptor protein
MDTSETAEQLTRVTLLASLSRADLRRIASLVTERTVPAGHVICRQGDAGTELLLVVDGEAAVDRDGRRLRVMGPGEAFGELALLDRGPRSATVTAQTDARLLVLAEPDFSMLVDEIPALAHRLLALLATRLREAESRALPGA